MDLVVPGLVPGTHAAVQLRACGSAPERAIEGSYLLFPACGAGAAWVAGTSPATTVS